MQKFVIQGRKKRVRQAAKQVNGKFTLRSCRDRRGETVLEINTHEISRLRQILGTVFGPKNVTWAEGV